MNIQYITSSLEDLQSVLASGGRWFRFVPKSDVDVQALQETIARCREQDAVVIIDDDAALCETVKADGVHVHQASAALNVRRQLGEEPLIGVEVNGFDEAKTARLAGADYLEVLQRDEVLQTNTLRELIIALYEADYPLPVSVSGQVSPDDIPTLSAAGVRGIATTDAQFFKKDVWALLDKLS